MYISADDSTTEWSSFGGTRTHILKPDNCIFLYSNFYSLEDILVSDFSCIQKFYMKSGVVINKECNEK